MQWGQHLGGEYQLTHSKNLKETPLKSINQQQEGSKALPPIWLLFSDVTAFGDVRMTWR